MLTSEQKQKINTAIDQLAGDPDIVGLVQSIEGSVKTTKDHYGKYMQALTQFSRGSKTMLYVVSRAMIKAGANVNGVNWAVKLING